MITPEFQLFCYALVTIAIVCSRHDINDINPFKKAPVVQTIVEPIIALVIEVTPIVKPVTYKHPAAKSSYLAACIIPVDSIAPTLPQGWDLDRNGNPLRGAALKGRNRKLGIE